MTDRDLKAFNKKIRELRRETTNEAVRACCDRLIVNVRLLLGKRRGDVGLEATMRRNAAALERAMLGMSDQDEPRILNYRYYLPEGSEGRLERN